MRLNPDCIRDILIYLEENLDYVNDNDSSTKVNDISWHQLFKDAELSEKYTVGDIKYSLQKLDEAGYIIVRVATGGNKGWLRCDIEDITWNGHQFLNNIRPKTVWEATKSGASKLGTMSIHALTTISSALIQGLVSNPRVIEGLLNNIGI